jgi:hypothetical protein
VIMGSVAAALGYFAVNWLWMWNLRHRYERRRALQGLKPPV